MGRKGYTAEQREQRRQADQQLRDQAEELLADADRLAELEAQFDPAKVSEKVANYSESNKALLFIQGMAMGRNVTDGETFRGWHARGRQVRTGSAGPAPTPPIRP